MNKQLTPSQVSTIEAIKNNFRSVCGFRNDPAEIISEEINILEDGVVVMHLMSKHAHCPTQGLTAIIGKRGAKTFRKYDSKKDKSLTFHKMYEISLALY